jgi:hypothetical protein
MTDLVLPPDLTPAPTTLFASDDPDVIVARATRIADVLAPVISDRHLYAPIRSKKYPTLEAWTLLGSLMPVMVSPHVVRTWQTEDGWGAHAETRTLEGKVVSAADAYCMRDEDDWAKKPHHQLASMASTRACSRAMRLPLSFVMSLTGYEVTPAEEMEAAARGETVSGGRGVQPGWRDIAEQQRAHADLGELIDNLGARQWVIEWCDSKGYKRPLAKGQFNQLRKAIEREFEQSDPGSRNAPDTAGDSVAGSPGSDPTSGAGERKGIGGLTPTAPDRHDPAPGTTSTSPSALEQEEASELARSRAEGANHQSKPEPGAGTPPSGAASPPDPASPPRGRAGGTNSPAGSAAKGARPASSVRGRQGSQGESHGSAAGRAPSSDAAEQAAFEQTQAGDDPGRFAR